MLQIKILPKSHFTRLLSILIKHLFFLFQMGANLIIKIYKIFTAFLFSLLVACGGGESTTTSPYRVEFNGNVSGLPAGQSITLVGNLPSTGQSTTINISGNGPFSSFINLPSGYTSSNMGEATATVSKQPITGECSVRSSFSLNITVVCAEPVAAGFYRGSMGALTTTMLILSDNSSWMWWGTQDSVTFINKYQGVIQNATGYSTSSTYTSTAGWDIFSSPPVTNISIDAALAVSYTVPISNIGGPYPDGTKLTGTITNNGTTSQLKLLPSPGSRQFAPPSLQTIAGTYVMDLYEMGKKDTASFVIDSSGIFSGITTLGCSFNGIVTPMMTEENAYKLTTAFGPSPCTFENTQMSGVAFLESIVLGTQLFGATINKSNGGGIMYIGTKS